jgi:hypothetical protein
MRLRVGATMHGAPDVTQVGAAIVLRDLDRPVAPPVLRRTEGLTTGMQRLADQAEQGATA